MRINGNGIAALKSVLPPVLYSRLEACCAIILPGATGAGPSAKLDALTAQSIAGPNLKAALPITSIAKDPHGSSDSDLNCDRTVLRNVLLRGLEQHIEFGKEFVSYEVTPNGVTVRFDDGTETHGSLLIGADGARSHVTKQFLPKHQLVDTEGRWIYGKTLLTPELEAKFNTKALSGLTLTHDYSRELPVTLLLEPVRFKDNEFRADLPADYVYWVLQARKDIFDLDDAVLLNLSPHEVAALAMNVTQHWHPSFHALFEFQEPTQSSILRIASVRPEITTWDSSNCITLIGDTVHVMSPTAGVGAVTALRDAANLAKLLEEESVSAESLGRYQTAMREYAGEAIRRSQVGGKFLFGMRPFEELKAMAV